LKHQANGVKQKNRYDTYRFCEILVYRTRLTERLRIMCNFWLPDHWGPDRDPTLRPLGTRHLGHWGPDIWGQNNIFKKFENLLKAGFLCMSDMHKTWSLTQLVE